MRLPSPHKFQIAVLPGDDKPDPGLEPFSTVAAEDRNRLWAYFIEGGADNMARLARLCRGADRRCREAGAGGAVAEGRYLVAGRGCDRR